MERITEMRISNNYICFLFNKISPIAFSQWNDNNDSVAIEWPTWNLFILPPNF